MAECKQSTQTLVKRAYCSSIIVSLLSCITNPLKQLYLLSLQEIEPIKLVWAESSKCFYSDEFKIPTGKYVGNLVIDGVFYPVEDITVKHYTFEVDLYLKDGKFVFCLL